MASQYLQAPYTADTNPQHTQTIEAWFYTEGAAPLNVVYSQDRYGSNFDKCLASRATSVQVATAGTTINWQPAIPIEMREPLKNGLHHLCLFTRPSPSPLVIFIDGIKIATNTFAVSNNGNPVTIGCHSWNNPNSFFNATILRYRQTNERRYPENFIPSHPSTWEPV